MMNACPRWSFLAGATLLALGCSDPVPPPAQAAVSFSVGSPVVPVSAMSCPITGKTYEIGASKNGTPDAPTQCSSNPMLQGSCSFGTSVISGENGSSISCSVKGSGTFSFSGSVQARTAQGELINLSFSNGTASASAPGGASASLYTSDLLETISSVMPCTITVLNNQVKGGSLWANFSCDQLAMPPSDLCHLTGTVVFENCSGS